MNVIQSRRQSRVDVGAHTLRDSWWNRDEGMDSAKTFWLLFYSKCRERERERESWQREWEICLLLFHSPNACSRQGRAREKPGAASQCGVSLMVAGMEWYESSCPVCHPRHTLARSWNEVHLNLASDRGYGCARWPLNVKCLFHSVLRKNLDQWDLELSRFCNPFQASGHLLCVMNFL